MFGSTHPTLVINRIIKNVLVFRLSILLFCCLDKMCDQISDAVLDAHLQQDPDAKVACETVTKTGMIMVREQLILCPLTF